MLMRTADRLVAPHGLTSARWLLLAAIDRYEQDAPPTLSEVSADALLSLQNVSRMVAALEADGLVERFAQPGKGRATFVRLTDAGRCARDKAAETGRWLYSRLLDGLPASEVGRLESALTTLIGNLDRLEAVSSAPTNAAHTDDPAREHTA